MIDGDLFFDDEIWWELVWNLVDMLFGKVEEGKWDLIDEVIVVLDGVFWYLFFEFL